MEERAWPPPAESRPGHRFWDRRGRSHPVPSLSLFLCRAWMKMVPISLSY